MTIFTATMSKPKGREKQYYGPKILLLLPTMAHIKLRALAKIKNSTVSQVIRDLLAEALDRQWPATTSLPAANCCRSRSGSATPE